ncbi:uncharacterized protein SPSK_08157 [Sporothrix schenckii 1099-18]|uniref:Uncharacterized protein n=1 Tax=Sporothrix schenckii 1099-18 TaxID=1397361 RepID=A0A0F2MJT0_SPOSC|nr:uncharacterized protein SPSK_08157 [Sporothrix schenckii 1099-18]KJR88431.1 hypothetical protein SPSK_08157 [Sporothrix schenckii 1099-18]
MEGWTGIKSCQRLCRPFMERVPKIRGAQRSAGEGPLQKGWVERARKKERGEREAAGRGSRERGGDAHSSWSTMGQWDRKHKQREWMYRCTQSGGRKYDKLAARQSGR